MIGYILLLIVIGVICFAGGNELGRKDQRADGIQVKILQSEADHYRDLSERWYDEAKLLEEELRKVRDYEAHNVM